MFLGEIIKQFREENNMTMETFAAKAGLSKGYISMLEKNKNPKSSKQLLPSIDTFKKAAKVMSMSADDLIRMTDGSQLVRLNQNEDDLTNITNISFPASRPTPMLGDICAGNGIFCEENFDGYFFVDQSVKADFCVRVRGDSMIDACISNNDIAFIKKTYDYKNNSVYAVLLNSECEATLKKVFWQGDTILLSPCNSEFEPMIVDASEVTILGECVGVFHNMK
jgi:repressor LexA